MTRWLTEEEQAAWRNVIKLTSELPNRLGRELQATSPLSLADYDVLVALTDVPDGRLRVFQLSAALGWEQSRLSHHLSRMVRRGLIERVECLDDGRGAYIVITPEGRSAIEAAAPGHVETVRSLVFDVLSPEEVHTLAALAGRILGNLDASDPRSPGERASA